MKKLVFIMIMFHGTLFAQNQAVNANYSLAERFSSSRIDKMVFDTKVIPNWLSTNQRFWYRYKTTKETFYYIVDLTKKTKEYLFDNHEMARMLSLITKNAYNYQHLPQINPKFKKMMLFFNLTSALQGAKEDIPS